MKAVKEAWGGLLKPVFVPASIVIFVMITFSVIYAGTAGFLDKIAVKDVGRYEAGLLKHLRGTGKDLLDDITKNDRKVKGELEDKIKAALTAFAKDFA